MSFLNRNFAKIETLTFTRVNIEQHITKLLLNNDCVIVPGFGGFMGHHTEAHYDAETRQFCPPSRTLGFNQQLTMNDSLLAQSLIEACDISYPEAINAIEAYVSELQHDIEYHGQHTFCGLGTISLSENGKYEFTPCTSGIPTPSLFALAPCEIDAIKTDVSIHDNKTAEASTYSQAEKSENPRTEHAGVALSQRHTTISVNTDTTCAPISATATTAEKPVAETQAQHPHFKLWRNIAAACIIVMAIMLMPAPNTTAVSHISGAKISAEMLTKIMPKDITIGQPNDTIFKAAAQTVTAQHDKITNKKIDVTADNDTSFFTIVLASKVSATGAEALVKRMHIQGHTQACVRHGKSGVMVTYGKYNSHEAATVVRNKLTDNIEYADCWIMHIR